LRIRRDFAAAAALYEAFAFAFAGADRKEGYPTFEDMLKRHEQLEGMLIAWDEQTQS
jgi:predicted dehydrogenase